MIKTLKENVVFQNKYITLQNNDVEFLWWKKWNYLKIFLNENKNIKDWVVIFCVNEENEVLIIKNYRYSIDKVIWELPRWKYEWFETPIEAWIRELKEETWVEKIINSEILWSIYTDSGLLCVEPDVVFLHVKTKQNIKLQSQENIYDFSWISIDDLKSKIVTGEIKDWFLHSALLKYILIKW